MAAENQTFWADQLSRLPFTVILMFVIGYMHSENKQVASEGKVMLEKTTEALVLVRKVVETNTQTIEKTASSGVELSTELKLHREAMKERLAQIREERNSR